MHCSVGLTGVQWLCVGCRRSKKERWGGKKARDKGEQVAPSRLPVGIQPSPPCTKVCPTCTKVCPTIEKVWTESPPVQDIQTLPDFKARMDAPWADHSGKKNMARYAEQKYGLLLWTGGHVFSSASTKYGHWWADNSWTTKLSIQFISTFTRSQN